MGRKFCFYTMIIIFWFSTEASATGETLIPLVFKNFPDPEEVALEDNADPSSKPRPRKKAKKRPKEFSAGDSSIEIQKLQKLVLKNFDGEQDGFIKLTDSNFIVFASNTGSLAQGMYLADLTNNSMEQFLHGSISIQATLKDKSGGDTLLLHHAHPMRGGVWGESDSLLSARKSVRNKILLNDIKIGSASYSEDESDDINICSSNPKAIIPKEYKVTVGDLNKDGLPDVTVKSEKFGCASKKSMNFEVTYLAGNAGFYKAGVIDTPSLLKAQKSAVGLFRKNKDNMSAAAQVLQEAGIELVIYEKPSDMSVDAYAGLLNDYAFFIGPYRKSTQALEILDKVIQMSPGRAVAYLNRSEQMYQMLYLVELKSQQEKISAAKDIMMDYATYKQLSGKSIEWLEKFTAFNLANYPANTNVCEFIKMYHDAGYAKGAASGLHRKSEIYLGSNRLDINNDGFVDDVDLEGYGQWTYRSISYADSKGKKYKFTGSVARKQDSGEGFSIFSFNGRVYQLLSMSDVTYIDHDKEKLMCEAEWSERNSDGRRYIKSIRLVN